MHAQSLLESSLSSLLSDPLILTGLFKLDLYRKLHYSLFYWNKLGIQFVLKLYAYYYVH
jgi:hypothetical protein